MPRRITKDEYEIRTLAYYQQQGGIYSQLITVLTRLRDKVRGIGTPSDVLNEACYRLAVVQKEYEDYMEYLKVKSLESTNVSDADSLLASKIDDATKIADPCLRYTLGVLLGTVGGYKSVLKAYAMFEEYDKTYYPYFKSLFENKKESQEETAKLKKQIADLQDEVQVKDGMLADTLAKVERLEKTLADVDADNYSKLDKSFTFASILKYAEDQILYSHGNQVVDLLKDHCAMMGATREYQMVSDLKRRMIEAERPLVTNNNDIKGSNVFVGPVSNPVFPMESHTEHNTANNTNTTHPNYDGKE